MWWEVVGVVRDCGCGGRLWVWWEGVVMMMWVWWEDGVVTMIWVWWEDSVVGGWCGYDDVGVVGGCGDGVDEVE